MTPSDQAPPSLLHAVRPWIGADVQREAIAFGETRLTYDDVAAHALGLAHWLRAQGAQPGDRIAAMITPRPESVIAYLACWLVGTTLVGINSRLRRDEQYMILADSEAKILLAVVRDGGRDLTPDLEHHRETLGINISYIGGGFWDGDLPPPAPLATVASEWDAAIAGFDPDIPAVIIYTSGSTGRPKGALITHAGLAFRSWSLQQDRFAIPHVRQLVDLPVNHIGALASGIGVSLVAGGFMVMAEQFNPAFTLAVTARERLDVIGGVPAMLGKIAEHPDFASADLSSVKYVNWGAGPIGAKLLDLLLQATTAEFSQQYGMTESNGPIVYTPPTRDREILLNTTGRPDPRYRLRIADSADQEVAPGAEGEVQVRQPHPFAGYLNNPEASHKAFTADGFLRTGDLAKIRDDGYLVFCGRSKEMFKSGGYNVYPREIELLLESNPHVRAAALLGVDDDDWGQVGHAFVELSSPTDIEHIDSWCRERLANYKVPKRIYVLEALPRTSVDKVDRIALSQLIGK